MSTNHTEHYELSQWLSTDQVQRTDFNADNAKLDAALQGLQQSITAETAARVSAIQTEQQTRAAALNEHAQTLAVLTERAGAHLLASGSLSQDGDASFSIPLSDIQWDEWKIVYLVLQVAVSSGSNTTYYGYLNGVLNSELFSARSNHSGHSATQMWSCVVFLPLFNGARRLLGFGVALESGRELATSYHFNDLESLLIAFKEDSGVTFQAGSMYQIFGEK